ncbi:MAG: hypothetical protein ACM3ME_08300 [Chloroflexota bacterium]|jgi:hypothetical protein|nr:hypothetical protein [Lentimicrobium sp.]
MKSFFLLLILCVAGYTLKAQNAGNASPVADTIYQFKNNYIYDAHKMNIRDMKRVMKPYPVAIHCISNARANYAWSTVIGLTGALFVGYSAIYASYNMKVHVPSAFIGVGTILMAGVFSRKGDKYLRRSIRIFNEAQKYPAITYLP